MLPSESSTDDDARDLADCRPVSLVKTAAGAVAFSGVGSLMLALQGVLIVGPVRTTVSNVAFATEALLGIGLSVMAVQLLRMQLWATVVSAALSLLTASLILLWSLFALDRGLFSILGFVLPGLCMIGCLLSLAAVGPAGRANAARERLRGRGVSLGL